MSDKGRIAAILGAVAVVAGGGLYYFFKIYAPDQQRAAAQAEVTAWEERLAAARSCLFGDSPASGDSAEALAVRELTPDPWDRGTCTKLIGRLNRGIAEDTGLLPVEHAWMSIDRAAARVASSFATHVDPFGETPEKRGKDSPLPAALQELDAAHATLREAAGMSPPQTATLAKLPALELLSLSHGDRRVTSLDSIPLPSATGSVAFGATGKGQVQLVLAAGQAPKIVAVPHRALRALPDLSWGTAGLAEQLVIAPVDDAGAFGTPTNVAVPGSPFVLAAVGPSSAGLVVASTGGSELVFVRAADGQLTTEPTVRGRGAHAVVDPTGRALVAWNAAGPPPEVDRRLEIDDTSRLRGFLARGDAAPVPVELGAGYPRAMCMTARGGWIEASGQLISFDGTTAVPHTLPDHQLLGCSHDAALILDYTRGSYRVCREGCELADLVGLPRATSAATLANGAVHAIRIRGRVLAVFRQHEPPTFFSVPDKLDPLQVTSDGEVLDVLAMTDGGPVIARIPLP